MAPKYRCPKCKRWLSVEHQERWNLIDIASHAAVAAIAAVAIVVGGVEPIEQAHRLLGGPGIAAVLAVGAVLGLLVYRHLSRNVRRYYCESCDKTWRGDFLRERE